MVKMLAKLGQLQLTTTISTTTKTIRFRDLRTWALGITDLGIQEYIKGLRDFCIWIFGFRDIEIQRYKDWRIQGFSDLGI